MTQQIADEDPGSDLYYAEKCAAALYADSPQGRRDAREQLMQQRYDKWLIGQEEWRLPVLPFYWMHPDVSRSGIFCVAQTAGPAIEARLATGMPGRPDIYYRGPRLTQTHLLVLLELLWYQRGNPPGARFWITARSFAIRQLGWPDSSHSTKRLRDVLLDLRGAVLVYAWEKGSRETAVTLLDGYDRVEDVMQLRLHPSIRRLFTRYVTHIPRDLLRRVKPGLQSALLVHFLASKCATKFELSRLRDCVGSNTRDMREFGRSVRNALAKLKEVGAITDYRIYYGAVFIEKR